MKKFKNIKKTMRLIWAIISGASALFFLLSIFALISDKQEGNIAKDWMMLLASMISTIFALTFVALLHEEEKVGQVKNF